MSIEDEVRSSEDFGIWHSNIQGYGRTACPLGRPPSAMALLQQAERGGRLQSSALGKRATVACLNCRARKVKCNVLDQGIPCRNCAVDGIRCRVMKKKRGRQVLIYLIYVQPVAWRILTEEKSSTDLGGMKLTRACQPKKRWKSLSHARKNSPYRTSCCLIRLCTPPSGSLPRLRWLRMMSSPKI